MDSGVKRTRGRRYQREGARHLLLVDNVAANSGSGGANFGTDDVGGVHYPRSKLVWGPDGTVNDADVASGKPLPIQLRTSGGTETGTTANPIKVDGAAAHDAAVSGNPVMAGAEARTSDGTAVANGDAVRAMADTLGKQVILIGSVHDRATRGTANFTNTTAADVIAAAGAGVRIAVTSVLVTNAHATVGTKVEIRDGTTVKIPGFAAPAGGGFSLNAGGAPLFISTANTAVTGRCVTTGADVDITISGYLIAN